MLRVLWLFLWSVSLWAQSSDFRIVIDNQSKHRFYIWPRIGNAYPTPPLMFVEAHDRVSTNLVGFEYGVIRLSNQYTYPQNIAWAIVPEKNLYSVFNCEISGYQCTISVGDREASLTLVGQSIPDYLPDYHDKFPEPKLPPELEPFWPQ